MAQIEDSIGGADMYAVGPGLSERHSKIQIR